MERIAAVSTTRFISAGSGLNARIEANAQPLSAATTTNSTTNSTTTATTATTVTKKKQGGGPRLNDVTRLEIIALLRAPNRPSLRKIGAQFDVCEATIRHIRDSADAITTRALAVPEDVRKTTLRVVQKTFPELEKLLAQWLANISTSNGTNTIDSGTISDIEPELVMLKAEELAAQLGIREHEFKASKIWLKNFRRRQAAQVAARKKAQVEAAARALMPPASTEESSSSSSAAATGEKKRKRGSGPRLSDGQRLEIIQKLHDPSASTSNRKLAEEYSVDEATIRHIKLNANAFRERALNAPVDVRQTTFRAGKAKFTELEAILAEWIDVSRRCNEEIPPPVVRRKAEEVAVELEMPEGKFKATQSWYVSFCRRHGIGPVSPIYNLKDIVAEYDPSDVFTVDETGLFYGLLPCHELLIPSVQTESDEREMVTERVTLVLCCNATGRERLPVSMVSKANHAADWPLPHFHQSNGWMDNMVFTKWFDQVFEPFILQQRQESERADSTRKRRVLLLLDNAPGHPVSFEKGDIRVLALHPKSSSWVQPLEMGVLTALKNRYKQRVLNDILAFHALPTELKNQLVAGLEHVEKGTAGVFFGKAPHLMDAARRIVDSWASLSPELLKCAFQEANFVAQFKQEALNNNNNNSDNGGSRVTAIHIEAEEFKLEEDMFKALRGFFQSHATATTHQGLLRNVGDGHEASSSFGSDAALAEELQTFLHLDDESSHVYQKCIIDDIDAANSEDEERRGHEGELRTFSAAASFGENADNAREEQGIAAAGCGSLSTSSSAMNRILNGVSAVSATDAFNTATVLGMQLRQLDASCALDAKQIQDAVLMVDTLRSRLLDARHAGNLTAAVVPVDAANGAQQQQALSTGNSDTSSSSTRRNQMTARTGMAL